MIICIDLGSNTLRACLMNESLEVIKSYEKIVGSARNLSPKGLADDAMERIKSGLKEIKNEFDFGKFRHKAVATEAFRLADNAKAFFDDILVEFGIKFTIISGQLEARLTKLGVQNRADKLGIDITNALLIDLGGASTEIGFKDEFKSFRFGIVKFCEECLGEDLSSFKNYDDFENMAIKKTKEAREFISKFKFNTILLTSGVPTSVAALKLGLTYSSYDAKLVNGLVINEADMDATIELIKTNPNIDELTGDSRAGLVLGGIWLLKSMLDSSKPWIVIDDGLREGIAVGAKINLI
ncbi:exopolyphosphatase, Ppx/GppA family [Campylobacter iguaniorum]|uniref:Ppx/GppA phosphatase family protein n=1 Tax=Campylobacter iguaniorum TaxID=1244531 RepID=UPI00073AAC8B|nr:phosphatase [Campylobacter iguaniorum]ALV24492.1 exopolyphosphatase, Ppx/GppA family [Campylobacter iguaniorum]